MSNKQNEPPTILLVEQDDQTRPLLMYNLRRQGFHVRVVLEEEDALERISGNNACPDLILLNQVICRLTSLLTWGGASGVRQGNCAARRLSLWLRGSGRIWKAWTF